MTWICWWRKPHTPSKGDAGLLDGKREEITLCIDTSESSAGTKTACGTVLPPPSSDAGRKRFFRHRRVASGKLLTPRPRLVRSSEDTVEVTQPLPGQPLLLEGLRHFDSVGAGRSAYFTRGGYAVTELQGFRLRAPAIARLAATLEPASGRGTNAPLDAGLACGWPEKSGTDD